MSRQPGKIQFEINRNHILRGERGNPRRTPLALALLESRILQNPRTFPIKTIEDDHQGAKIRTHRHSPPLTRWLNQWARGESPGPIRLDLDLQRGNISVRKGG